MSIERVASSSYAEGFCTLVSLHVVVAVDEMSEGHNGPSGSCIRFQHQCLGHRTRGGCNL